VPEHDGTQPVSAHFHHVVLFRLKADADPDRVLATLDAAKPVEGLVSWLVQKSMDERKGSVIAELAVFESRAAFETWRGSDLHQSAAAELSTLADWLVADWV
jgi:hypothetical protein